MILIIGLRIIAFLSWLQRLCHGCLEVQSKYLAHSQEAKRTVQRVFDVEPHSWVHLIFPILIFHAWIFLFNKSHIICIFKKCLKFFWSKVIYIYIYIMSIPQKSNERKKESAKVFLARKGRLQSPKHLEHILCKNQMGSFKCIFSVEEKNMVLALAAHMLKLEWYREH